MKCQECKFKYPVRLLSWMTDSQGLQGLVCGVCALNLSNAVHGVTRLKFDGEKAEAMRVEAIKHRKKKATHYVVKNSGNALFVKEANFFEEQGGLDKEWGMTWIPVIATSIGDARKQASQLYGVKLSHIHDGEA